VIAAAALVLLFTAADQPIGDQIAVAIERGDIAAIKDLVEAGTPADTPIDYGSGHAITPLIKAAERGKRDIVKYLIAKGANVNAKGTDDGQTALMAAITRGFDDVVDLLIAAGADVKAKDARGNTAFALAVFGAHLEIAEVLLKHGADPNQADPYGITPLLGAASTGGEEALRFLVKSGAKVNLITQLEYGGQTALTTAARVGNVDNVRTLLDLGADPRLKMKDGGTALQCAKDSGNAEVVALITAALAKAPAAPAKATARTKPAEKKP
jgi:ankyrin repeat protein